MVNYHDPSIVAQDYCACTFVAKHVSLWGQLTSIDSGNVKGLACCGWTLLVCLPRPRGPSTLVTVYDNNNLVFSFPAGSLSLLLITSGVSSEGVAPSVGRYGLVMRAFCCASLPGAEHLTNLSPLAGLLHYAHSHSNGYSTFLS